MKKINVTFISGNQNKINYLNKFFEVPLDCQKIELEEIQTLDILELVKHKVREAYVKVGKPVLVEDVSLEFPALGKLPGTFIKFFLQEMSLQDVCDLLKGKDRTAIARCVFGYYDGVSEKYFEKSLKGRIVEVPGEESEHGYGWDQVFIPVGHDVVRSALNKEDYEKIYLLAKPILEVKDFLENM